MITIDNKIIGLLIPHIFKIIALAKLHLFKKNEKIEQIFLNNILDFRAWLVLLYVVMI